MGLLQRIAGLFGSPRDQARPGRVRAEPTPPHDRTEVSELPRENEALRIVEQIYREAMAASGGRRATVADSPRWIAVKSSVPKLQLAVLLAALGRSSLHDRKSSQVEELRKAIVSQLLRRTLPFAEAEVVQVLQAWLAQPYSLEYGLSGGSILSAAERYLQGATPSPALTRVLRRLHARALRGGQFGQGPTKYELGVAQRTENLLVPSRAGNVPLPRGEFGQRFQESLSAQTDGDRVHWLALARLAVSAGDKSKPTRKWLEAAAPHVGAVDRGRLAAELSRWLDRTAPDPARPDVSLDILRGLIWVSTLLDHEDLAGQVGRFAETCFRKVSGIGARSVRLGNAALWALSEMAGEPRAAAELFRLRQKIKQPSTRKTIDTRLSELARRTGQSLEEMEDLSLPDFGLDPRGTLVLAIGDARAELVVRATEVVVSWFSSAGRPVKGVPSEVRADHRTELVAARRLIQDIDEARAAQVSRLEQSWLENRSWSFADWEASFLRHPLRRPIVEALVWRIGSSVVLPGCGVPTDVEGRACDIPPEAGVTLWHPLDGTPAQVLAWRRRILALGLTQPLKQAHREVYVLTDAERRTGVYSNRFAAHILRQHQFRALCRARGWTYDLMGGWDNWNMPTRVLPRRGLSVQYHVDVVDDGRTTDAGVALHLSSDQVRFTDGGGRPVELEAISPIVFSEVMRDVDLFVAVTSVANDPGWADGGPDGRHGNYWREWAFGELGQSAETRRELVAWIAPRLSIADRLEVTDKFLMVQGKRQRYAIHFGSGNIQIRPSNRYLCIVQDRAPPEANSLKLPFTGDGTLSAILSKAFLLVDENKIRDPTILRQL